MSSTSKKLWGYPRQGVTALPPSDDDLKFKFIWSISGEAICSLIPSEPATPPEGRAYPKASEYICNEEFDPQYASGYFFHTDYYTSDAPALRLDMTSIDTPPFVDPTVTESGALVRKPIPAMHQLLPGYAYVAFVNGDPKCAYTETCLHTLKSLRRWPKIFLQIEPLVLELLTLTFGRVETPDKPGVTPIFEFLAVHNGRSPGQAEGSFDGSYNLAGTNSEGQGSGLFKPAIQTENPTARAHIKRVLELVHALWRLIMPLCISKLEWDILEFHAILCNIMAFGGCEPGPTACQLNVSSSATGGDLVKWIGKRQGWWHVDQKDDPCRRTLLLIFLRLPKGG